jgi:hypothetical protein
LVATAYAGFQTLLVIQAVPTGAGPAFYSIEWNGPTNVIVRALEESGQQMWMTHLVSSASPQTLKHILPAPGQVFQNEALVSDHSMFIRQEKRFCPEQRDRSQLLRPPHGR